MSSTSKVTTQIKDLALLKQSLKDLGHAYETNVKGIRFYGEREGQDLDVYVSSRKFGFIKQEDGFYKLVADSDHKKVYNKVTQTYTVNKVKKQLSREGFTVAGVKELENGKIEVQARRAYA